MSIETFAQDYMIEPPFLPGEAASGAYGALDGDGRPADLSLSVFPILRRNDDTALKLIGTGFFITTNGLFVTARHVLLDVLDSHGNQRFPIGLLQFLPGNRYIYRPILRCVTHEIADVGVGVAAPIANAVGEPLTNKILTLTTVPAPVGSRVVTYAYPKHSNFSQSGQQVLNLTPTFYDGDIEEYFPHGRDRTLLPAPCYRTNMVIHGGASGGPVFTRSGWVFGVNSTGMDGTNVSHVSRVDETLTLLLNDISIDGKPARPVRMVELIERGHIICRPPPSDVPRLLAHLEKA
jgi:hypothetical protein